MGRKTKGMTLLVLLAALGSGCSSKAPEDAAATPKARADAAERSALVELRARVAADKAKTVGLRILRQGYRHEAQPSGWSRPHLDLVLENGTPLTVSKFTVLATLLAPGNDEPLLRQEFTVRVSVPIEPGQRHETTMVPTPDSKWGLLVAPRDSRMQAEMVSLETPSGERFLASGSFDAFQARRLAELEAAAD